MYIKNSKLSIYGGYESFVFFRLNIYICVTSGVTNKKGNNMGNLLIK